MPSPTAHLPRKSIAKEQDRAMTNTSDKRLENEKLVSALLSAMLLMALLVAMNEIGETAGVILFHAGVVF